MSFKMKNVLLTFMQIIGFEVDMQIWIYKYSQVFGIAYSV
jgi:hypothetical protein